MPDPVPLIPPIQPPPPPAGLVNAAPGATNTTPGTSPAGAAPGAPVTSYQPATADVAKAQPDAYTVAPDATVASQLKGLIDAGSPLFQQAEANARAVMNRRGLVNSSQAITAGQKAVIETALPIATADAGTFDRAATNTVNARNTAGLANAAAETQVNEFNAGQENAALDKAATASNTVALTAQKGVLDKAIADLQANTQLELSDRASATQKILADIQASTALSVADKQAAQAQAIANLQASTSRNIAELQADTALTEQERAVRATAALHAQDGVINKQLQQIQADTSLSIAEKQAATQRLVASLNSTTAKEVQELQNAGALANIRANGQVSTALQILGDQNRALLQSNAGAANLYNTALQKMSDIVMNPSWDAAQKTTALNNLFQGLTDGLGVMTSISGTPGVQSLLQFTNDPTLGATGQPPPPANNEVARRTAEIQNLYATVLRRPADAAGLNYWAQQAASGMSIDQIRASMAASPEGRALAA